VPGCHTLRVKFLRLRLILDYPWEHFYTLRRFIRRVIAFRSSPSAAKYLKTKSDFAADTPANKKSPPEGTGGKDKERRPYY